MNKLLNAYNYSLENNFVDNHNSENDTVLLPLYHTNLRSDGKNIVEITLNSDGSLYNAEFIEKDRSIIFPITEDSVARSGKNPPPHPLVDKLNYIENSKDVNHTNYLTQLNNWRNYLFESKDKDYLDLVYHFITTNSVLNVIVENIFHDNEYGLDGYNLKYSIKSKNKYVNKKIDLSKVYITFKINDFLENKNVDVTTNKSLHNSYIVYIDSIKKNMGYCNISGDYQRLTSKHRGLLGNAKLMSVSNNKETYYGRFKKGTDIVQVGYKTSEKIHLMLKFFLENKNSSQWLSGQQYLINWFSDDLNNEEQFDISHPFGNFEPYEDDIISQPLVGSDNQDVGESFFKGRNNINENNKYFVAIIDKASNGRLSSKYFKELHLSSLINNLNRWSENYSFNYYNAKNHEVKTFSPALYKILVSSYGIERNGSLVLDNDNFKKDQFQKMIMSVVEGKDIPWNLVIQMKSNITQRLRYKDTWQQLLFVALAILNNIEERRYTYMIDRENTNRSYLFGRLLALYDRTEAATFNREGSDRETDNKRVTNAQRFWTSFSNRPATIMNTLENKVKSYEKNLNSSNPGLLVKIQKEKNEILGMLGDYLDSSEINKPLSYDFIFGYYAETQFLFTRKKEESVTND